MSEKSPTHRLRLRLRQLRFEKAGPDRYWKVNERTLSHQVWYVSYPGGQTQRITNDLHSYGGLSLTGDGSALVTVQNETTSHIWVVAPGNPGREREIGTGRFDVLGLNGIAWADNANIAFEAPDSDQTTQLWITAADATGRRQIATESGNGRPAACGDGRHLVFMSYRATTPHIFRSDPEGGNVRPLTDGKGEFGPSCSPDGLWITYTLASWIPQDPESRGVFRMPIDGGKPKRIWDRSGWSAISPDGKLVLIRESVGPEPKVRIIPAGGGQPLKSFDPASELGGSDPLQWADGNALLYVKTVGDVSNIWRRPLTGGQPKQVTSYTRDRITSFAVSPDGKRLALGRGKTSSDVVMIRDLK